MSPLDSRVKSKGKMKLSHSVLYMFTPMTNFILLQSWTQLPLFIIYISFFLSSTDGHWGVCQCLWPARNGAAGPYGGSIFSFWRNNSTCNACISLHSCHEWVNAPLSHILASPCCQLFSLLIFGFPVAFYCNKLTKIKTLPSFLKLINSRRILMYTQHNTSQQKQSHAGATAN